MSAWEAARETVHILQQAGFDAYFAGGCVRDRLLGIEAKDIDIATAASPDQVQSLFPRTTGLEGKCFGVVRVLQGEHTFEVATFRKDGTYTDGRRPNAVEFSTAEVDAQRRDFTINGIFYDPLADRYHDFVGGREDLENRVVRAIGNPEARFGEDKLRLLRAVRFTVNLKFQMEPATAAALQQLAPGIATISAERIRDELDKIWSGPHPARGLDLLDQSGLLAVILPEIHALHGVEQPPQFHPEGDVFIHTRLMLKQLHHAPLVLALSVLFHDVGKKPTMKVDPNGRIRFNGHETVGARMTEVIMTRLRYSNEMIASVQACVVNHMTFKDVMRMNPATIKRLLARSTIPIELELHRIDCQSSHGDISNFEYLKEQQSLLSEEEIRPPRLVTGRDLLAMGLPSGPAIGDILGEIEEGQLEGKIRNREEALTAARRLAANY